jgi:hypothetical protein
VEVRGNLGFQISTVISFGGCRQNLWIQVFPVQRISWNPSASLRWTLLFETSEDYVQESRKGLHYWFWRHWPNLHPWTYPKLYSEFIFPYLLRWLLVGWWMNCFKDSTFWWHRPKLYVQVSTRQYTGILTCSVVCCGNQNVVMATYWMTGFGCPEQNRPENAEAAFHSPDVRHIHRQQAAHEECHSMRKK